MSTPTITVTANLQQVTGAIDAASVTFELVGFGSTCPRVGGTAVIVQTSTTVTADGSGNISVVLWGNDVITPAGTYYNASFYNEAGGLLVTVAYQFTGSGSFDLSQVVPMGQQVVAQQQPNSAIPQIFSPLAHQFLTGMNSLGVFSSAQPAFTDLSGTISAGQLIVPTATTLGGVKSLAAVTHKFLTSIGTDGLPVAAQPAAADLSNGVTGSGAVVLAASPTLSGTINTGNLIVNPSATGSGAALTVGGTSATTGGLSVFVGALGSQTERAAVYPADGITSAFRIGALSVRSLSAGFLSGAEVASISRTGQIVSSQGGGGTSSGVYVSTTNPAFGLNNASMAADNRLWDIATDGLGHLLFRTINDAQTAFANWLTVTRSGASVTSVDFSGATAVTALQFLADGSVSAPSHSFASETNSGWFRQQAGIIGFGIGGSYLQQHTATRIGYAPAISLGWASGAPNSFSNDTSLNRISAGVLGVGTSGSSTAGTVQAALFQGMSSTAFTVGAISATQRIVFSSPNAGFEFGFLTSTNAAAGIQIIGIDAFENNGRTSAAGHAALWPDLTSHFWKANNNAGSSYNLVGDTTTQTLTNKRITQRVISTNSAAAAPLTITADSDNFDLNAWVLTGTGGTITVSNPTGTPTDGQKLTLRIKSTNAMTYAFGTNFAFSTSVTAPTTLAAGKTDYLGCLWNATNSKWDVVSVDQGH